MTPRSIAENTNQNREAQVGRMGGSAGEEYTLSFESGESEVLRVKWKILVNVSQTNLKPNRGYIDKELL